MHAPMLIIGGKKKERKLVCNTEIATYMSQYRGIADEYISKL